MSKRIVRRSIAALLAAVMMFTAVPVSASAADATGGTFAEGGESDTEQAEGQTADGVSRDEETGTSGDGKTGAYREEEAEAEAENEIATSEDGKEITEKDTADDSVITDESTEEVTEDSETEAEFEEETQTNMEEVLENYEKIAVNGFVPRTTNPENNTYYTSGNPYSGPCNCTYYVWGRAHELLGYKPYTWQGNAGNWWDNNDGYERGDVPRLGAIMCWGASSNNAYGHVAVVEAIGNGTISFSEASYSPSYAFAYKENISTSTLSNIYRGTFQGYIYLPIFDRVKGTYMDTGYSRVIPDGDYHIVSSQGDNWWLTNSGFSMDNGGNVNIWDYVNIDMECIDHVYNFKFIDSGDGRGFYKITNKLSGKCLDVDGGSEYLYDENGKRTNVQQWEDNGSSAQQWAVNEINAGDEGMFYTFQARCSSYYLDVEGGKADCGSNIGVWTTGSDSAQQWRLVPYAPTVGQTIEDGEYQIVYHAAENKAIGFTGNKIFNGVNVELSSAYKGDYKQTFEIKYLGNGYYSIINKYSGLSLDVSGGPNMRRLQANIQLWATDDKSNAQKWIIQSCGNGYYNVLSKCNGLYLDLDGGDLTDGTNIQLWKWQKDAAIKWKFVPYVQSKLPTPTSTLSNSSEVEAGTKFYLDKNGAETVYYTWDGTNPTKQSPEYSDSTGLTIPTGQTTCILKAFGVKEGYQDSDILEITYNVKQKKPSGEEGGDTNPEDDPQDGVKWHYNEQNVAYKDLAQYGKITTSIKPKTYDGTPYKPIVKVTTIENGKTVTLTEGPDYRVLYYNNIHAGTGSLTVKGNGVYKGTISKTFEIKKKSCKKLKVVTNSMLTGDSQKPKIYVYDGKVLLKENKDYVLDGITPNFTATKGTKQISIMAAQNSDYEGMTTAKITVYDANKGRIIGIIDRPENVNLSQSTYQYTGKACKPTAVVTVDGNILTQGKDYTIKYQNNKNAGTAFATIKGKGNYVGSIVKEFTIEPSNAEFTLKKPIAAVTYNGKLQKPKITVKADGKTLRLNKDYTLSYTNNLHATDSAKVTVRGKGNYADAPTKVFYFTINPCHIKKASVKGGQGSLLITHAKHTLVEGVDYDVVYGAAAGKGKISVTIKAKEGSSFTGEVTKKVKQ